VQYWSHFRKRCCCTLAQTDWSWIEPEASCRRFNGISQIQKWYSNDFQCRWIGSIIKEIRISSSYLYNYILVLILTNLVLSIIWSRIIWHIRLALFGHHPCKFLVLKPLWFFLLKPLWFFTQEVAWIIISKFPEGSKKIHFSSSSIVLLAVAKKKWL
jgi:hypothetical protein